MGRFLKRGFMPAEQFIYMLLLILVVAVVLFGSYILITKGQGAIQYIKNLLGFG